MHIGEGSPWLGVLLSIPFALLSLWLAIAFLVRLGHGLTAALRLASLPAAARAGAIGRLRSLFRDALGLVLLGLFSALSGAMALAGLMHYKPAIGLAHPYMTLVADSMTDAAKAQRELTRGLKAGNRSLVELALAIGADPSNSGESTSLLEVTTDSALRALLIEQGAPVDGLAGQASPLRVAVDQHDRAFFEQLLRAGARAGLEPSPGYPRHLLEWMAEANFGVEWLDSAIAAGVDLNAAGYGGASLYDTLSLTAPAGDWWQRLSAAGLQNRLPLHHRQVLPVDHAGIRHALAWLRAPGTGVDVDGHPDWELPEARPDASTWIDLPHTDPVVLEVHGLPGDLLIRVRGIGFGSRSATVVVRVIMVVAESGEMPAEADLSLTSAAQFPQSWRVVAIWEDARPD